MTPMQKFAALNALCSDRTGNYGASIVYSETTGEIYVSAPVEISDGTILTSVGEHRNNCRSAIEAFWQRLTELQPGEHLRVANPTGEASRVRWNGYMWQDVTAYVGDRSETSPQPHP